MKKIICFIISVFITIIGFADEYLISTIECVEPDNFYDSELTLKYDDENDVYYIFRSTFSRSYWFTFTPEKLEQLRNNLKKAKEWSKLANSNKSSINKELPNSLITVEGTMKSGNDWYTTRWDIPLNFFFISSFSDGVGAVTLLMRGGAQESKQNQFIDVEFESVVFINSEIDDFFKAISKETVEKEKENRKKQKKDAELFN